MYLDSTVNYRDGSSGRELDYLDFCWLGVLVASAALDTWGWVFHTEELHLWLNGNPIAVIGEEGCLCVIAQQAMGPAWH